MPISVTHAVLQSNPRTSITADLQPHPPHCPSHTKNRGENAGHQCRGGRDHAKMEQRLLASWRRGEVSPPETIWRGGREIAGLLWQDYGQDTAPCPRAGTCMQLIRMQGLGWGNSPPEGAGIIKHFCLQSCLWFLAQGDSLDERVFLQWGPALRALQCQELWLKSRTTLSSFPLVSQVLPPALCISHICEGFIGHLYQFTTQQWAEHGPRPSNHTTYRYLLLLTYMCSEVLNNFPAFRRIRMFKCNNGNIRNTM